MKLYFKTLLALCLMVLSTTGARAAGWPANYEGVMLQGFYWNSYTDSKWTNLESQADELSKYFSLIWVPNSARASSNPGMGYDPVYWFTNHNTAFGTEAELRSMIKTFKAKGTGIIADVVINHRNGATNWTDFPTEQWNGYTWKIGTDGICSTDEVRNKAGEAKPTGAPDTGEDFDGCRDLDHTNANVQNNCKNYCKFLLDDLGYAGFRLDMVKGYAPRFTKIYNEYSRPTFSIGEYFDGNYDAVAAWIEGTGKTSAAFDFPCKFQINKAWTDNDMTQLVWNANGTTPQPAGMIHFGYTQYAVTFVDNHDTVRDGSKFTGNVVAANAFILCSPGTPCVFLPHYKANKAAIQRLIDIRNSVGLHNNSPVKVLRTDASCYMAEVTGSKGKLVVKIGPAMASPSGYSDSDIVASGNEYCVWTKTPITNGGGSNPNPPTPPTPSGDTPEQLYVMGSLSQGVWKPNVAVSMTREGDIFTATGVTLVPGAEGDPASFSFVTSVASTDAVTEWDAVVNATDRFGAASENAPATPGEATPMQIFPANVSASSAYSWIIEPGTYTIKADFANMTMTITTEGGENPNPPTPPTPAGDWTIYYDNSETAYSPVKVHHWIDATNGSTWPGIEMTAVSGNIYKATIPAGTAGLVFNDGGTSQTLDADNVQDGHLYKGLAQTAANSDGKLCNMISDEGEYNGGSENPNPPTPPTPSGDTPEQLYVMGSLSQGVWKPNVAVSMTRKGDIFTATGVTLVPGAEGDPASFSFVTSVASTDAVTEWDAVVNATDRFGAASENAPATLGEATSMQLFPANVSASSAYSWTIEPGTYTIKADFANMTMTITREGENPNPPTPPTPSGDTPERLYVMGTLSQGSWQPNVAIEMTRDGDIFTANKVKLEAGAEVDFASFSFVTSVGTTGAVSEWDEIVNSTNRFGAESENAPASLGEATPMQLFPAGFNASSAYSWIIEPGTYNITADFASMTMTISTSSSAITDADADQENEEAVYYNLNGVRVENPVSGLYIVVRGSKVTKELVK